MGWFEDALDKRFEQYESLLRHEEASSAFVVLGGILHVALNSELPNRLRFELLQCVEAGAKRAAVHSDLEAKLGRLRWISSIGCVFNDDEILLLLTIRVQLQMAAEMYAHLGWEKEGLVDPEVDANIREIIRTNEKPVQIALGLARKHWGLSLVTEWF